MNKNELEFEKAGLKAKQFDQVIGLAKHLVSVGGALWALSIFMKGVAAIVSNQSPDGIKEIANLVKAIPIGSVIGYFWGIGMTGLWWKERRGKKRAIRKKGEYQAAAENGEPNRTSSNLTETGDTP